MIMLLRRLALFFAMISAIVGAQLPEYAQQYRQRLGGAIDELNMIITRFNADAAQNGLTQEQGIARLQANTDEFVQSRGGQMQEIITRQARLANQLESLSHAGSFLRVWELTTKGDPAIAWRAYQSFEPGIPVTTEGVVSAIIGFVIGGGVIKLLSWPFEHLHRRRRRARQLEAQGSFV
jgi:hypothetical protein